MVIKRKTVSKVAATFKAIGKMPAAPAKVAATAKAVGKVPKVVATFKAVGRGANTPKASGKVKVMETEEGSEDQDVVMSRKMLKKPAASMQKAAQKEVAESDEEESEDESEESLKPSKTMKKPAASAKAVKAKNESEEDDEESEETEEEDTDDDTETVKQSKAMKRPASAAKAKAVSEDESEDESEEAEESETDDEEETAAKSKTMKKPAAATKASKKRDASEEESDEAQEEESDDEVESTTVLKTMKKPAAATNTVKAKGVSKPATAKKAATAKDLSVEESEGSTEEEEEEDESDNEQVHKNPPKTMKKPAAAAKAVTAEDESEEESEDEDEEESDEEEAPKKTIKKLAAASGPEEQMEVEEESEDEEMLAQIVPVVEDNKEQTEKEIIAERTRELKSMYVSDLKALASSNGLEAGSKESIIKALLKCEAKARMLAQEQKAKIRGVVIKKKQEFEDLSLLELGKLCNDAGLKGLKSKPERVQRLLIQWQQSDGVDNALAQIAKEERQQELEALGDAQLQKLCYKLGVDPFVKEIAVERISKYEHSKGVYARPAIKQPEEGPKEDKKTDMIEALLASEAQRKREKELKSKQEEAATQKMKELKQMSMEELTKRIAKKGIEAAGKRDDMVQALFIAAIHEDDAAARKTALQGKSIQALKDLVLLNGLETGSKDQMVKTMLAHEATAREQLKVFEAQVDDLAAKRHEELEKKTKAQLKDLCSSKGLPPMGDQEERIQRILEQAKKDNEFDKLVSMNSRSKRKQELMALDKAVVLKVCEKTGVVPFVPCIMVERILAHESLAGQAFVAKDADQPAPKKSRK